jgi:hypothetical protein
MRRGLGHRSVELLLLLPTHWVGQPQDVGTMCQVASSRCKASLGFCPSGLPLRTLMAVKFAQASLRIAPRSTLPGDRTSMGHRYFEFLFVFWICVLTSQYPDQ